MIQGYWGEIHGLFYPDGTIRDPATIAAIMFGQADGPRSRHRSG
ncbi:MAG: hypothetical protein P8020_19845 [Acidobacteriota bacterium]|jgi:hypothetical protein